jgi:opacity protein-like surface antigen
MKGVGSAAAVAVLVMASDDASAYERQWHLGLSTGYTYASFPAKSGHGFAGGLHATYGITDAFNLRLHSDVCAFDLPDPETNAVLFNNAFGAEYVFDILRWVPYIGAAVGPNTMFISKGPTIVHLDLEIPGGVGYKLTRSWTIGAEFRYRLLLLGKTDVSPMNNFIALGRVEYGWGS